MLYGSSLRQLGESVSWAQPWHAMLHQSHKQQALCGTTSLHTHTHIFFRHPTEHCGAVH